jgi:hypothetical protein
MEPDPVPDPAIFITDLQNGNKKQFFKSFSAFYFMKVTAQCTLTSFFKDKKS